MNKIHGLEVSVVVNGQIINVAADGFLRKVGITNGRAEITTMLMRLEAADDRFYAVDVDGNKRIVQRRNLNERSGVLVKPGKCWEQRVTVKVTDKGEQTAHTEYPNNSVRVLQFGEEGKVTVWEISMISQAGNFFLAVSSFDVRVYTAQGGKTFHTMGFSKPWKVMSEFIIAVARVEYDPATLLPLSLYTEAQQKNAHGLAPHTGCVLWWSVSQGFGSIVTNNHHGESVVARVHWQNLVRENSRFAHLVAGEVVSYTALNEPQNTKGRGTTFQVEAVGVKLLTPDFVPPVQAAKSRLPVWSKEEINRIKELEAAKKPPAKEVAPAPVATTPPHR